jgi:hypothetical protein
MLGGFFGQAALWITLLRPQIVLSDQPTADVAAVWITQSASCLSVRSCSAAELGLSEAVMLRPHLLRRSAPEHPTISHQRGRPFHPLPTRHANKGEVWLLRHTGMA